MLVPVSNKCCFIVKNMASPKSCKITRNKKYEVLQIGFDGSFLITSDTGRRVWYKNNYFKILSKRLNFKGVLIGKNSFDLGWKPTDIKKINHFLKT